MKKLTILILLIFSGLALFSQPNSYSFETIDSLRVNEPRPVAVFLHTDWCKFCQNMKSTTFTDQEVIELLDNQYYFTKLNGEKQSDILFNGRKFRHVPNGASTGTHELAYALGTVNGRVSYPTFIVLNEQMEIILQYDGFLNKRTMRSVLKQLVSNPE